MVVIRRADIEDLDALAAIGSRAWASSIFSFEPEQPGVLDRVSKAYRGFVEDFYPNILVAMIDGNIVGWGARDTGEDYISDLWVDPEWQGRGAGSALLTALKQEIADAGYSKARIDTHARNAGAVRLYQRNGFVTVLHERAWSESLGREIDKVKLEAPLI
ncbi:MAG: GNAT family N-acetyltransferase [Phyllobacterium sp.]